MGRHNEFGDWGEETAVLFLKQKGYIIKERDYRLGKRDIDIIALTEDELEIVFIEVKTRKSDAFIDPMDAVTPDKMRSIAYCANTYLKKQNIDLEPRFDIISIVKEPFSDVKIQHIENAFNPCLL